MLSGATGGEALYTASGAGQARQRSSGELPERKVALSGGGHYDSNFNSFESATGKVNAALQGRASELASASTWFVFMEDQLYPQALRLTALESAVPPATTCCDSFLSFNDLGAPLLP